MKLAAFAAGGGHLEVLQWARAMRMSLGMRCDVLAGQQKEDIRQFCSGLVQMAVHGVLRLARRQQEKVIWKYCSGLVQMAVHGTQELARLL